MFLPTSLLLLILVNGRRCLAGESWTRQVRLFNWSGAFCPVIGGVLPVEIAPDRWSPGSFPLLVPAILKSLQVNQQKHSPLPAPFPATTRAKPTCGGRERQNKSGFAPSAACWVPGNLVLQ